MEYKIKCDICKVNWIEKNQISKSTCCMCALVGCKDCMDTEGRLCKYCQGMGKHKMDGGTKKVWVVVLLIIGVMLIGGTLIFRAIFDIQERFEIAKKEIKENRENIKNPVKVKLRTVGEGLIEQMDRQGKFMDRKDIRQYGGN